MPPSQTSSAGLTRFAPGFPCPVCGGCEDDPRGMGSRCHGFLSSDGKYVHCAREERAHGLPFDADNKTYTHLKNGKCKCGAMHGPELNGAHKRPKDQKTAEKFMEAYKKQKESKKKHKESNGKSHGDYAKKLEETYYYYDANRMPILKVDRLRTDKPGDKRFAQYRPNGTRSNGAIEWTKGADGVELLPYQLPDLLKAPKGSVVYIAEGERKVDTLRRLGYVATCNVGGTVMGWKDSYSPYLKGFHIVILPDNDPDGQGQRHARQVARSIQPYVESIKVLNLPNLPPKGDIVDWVKAGGVADQLHELSESAALYDVETVEPEPETVAAIGGPTDPPDCAVEDQADDDSNPIPNNKADDDPHRLARNFLETEHTHPKGKTLVHHRGSFHRWTGEKYQLYPDAHLDLVDSMEKEFNRLNRELIRKILDKCIEDGVKAPSLSDLPVALSVTTSRVKNVVQALQSEVCVSTDVDTPAWIDEADTPDRPNPAEILPARNGLINLKTMECLPSTPRFFAPFAVPYDFDPKAPEPILWLKFLNDLWGDDPDSIRELRKWFGYLLSVDKSQEKALIIQGGKRAGKGTLITVAETLFGESNVVSTTFKDLSGRFGLWPLLDKTVAIIPDARFGSGADNGDCLTERLLSITSRDPVLVDKKCQQPIKARLPTRLIIFTNELPNLRENSGALASRFVLLRLKQSFFGREDIHLAAKLIREISSILRWAIEGRRMLREDRGFLTPDSATAAAESFQQLTSPILSFADECLDVSTKAKPDKRESLELDTFRDIHLAYQWWCRITKHNAASDNVFSRNLTAAFPLIEIGEKPRDPDGSRLRRCRGAILNEAGRTMMRHQLDCLDKARTGQALGNVGQRY